MLYFSLLETSKSSAFKFPKILISLFSAYGDKVAPFFIEEFFLLIGKDMSLFGTSDWLNLSLWEFEFISTVFSVAIESIPLKENDLVIITGSLYLAGEMLNLN